MRPIDADALETHEQLEPMGNGMYEYVQVVYKDDIDDAPTIELRRGRWREFQIGKCPLVECTACKMARDRREIPHENGGRVAWKFCPDCGADMREGDTP